MNSLIERIDAYLRAGNIEKALYELLDFLEGKDVRLSRRTRDLQTLYYTSRAIPGLSRVIREGIVQLLKQAEPLIRQTDSPVNPRRMPPPAAGYTAGTFEEASPGAINGMIFKGEDDAPVIKEQAEKAASLYDAYQARNEREIGKILYIIPQDMQVGKTERCIVRIASERLDGILFTEELVASPNTKPDKIRIGTVMRVYLVENSSTNHFDIVSLNTTEQIIYDDEYTEWLFDVTPLSDGNYTLYLKVTMTEILEKFGERSKDVEVLERKIRVKTSGSASPVKETGITRILFLGANPTDMTRLHLDREVREIDEDLKLARYRDLFQLISSWAVTADTLQQSMLDYAPQIVHFSGFANKDGIVVEDKNGQAKTLPAAALTGLFSLFLDCIKCVVLNACYSEPQAEAISRQGIYVIGINNQVSPAASIEFTTGFYKALGAGRNMEFAFKMGVNKILLEGLTGADAPVLWKDGRKLAFQ